MARKNKSTEPSIPRHLPARTVAYHLGVSIQTLRRWAKEGRNGFPTAINLPGCGLMFQEAAIVDWLARQERVAPDAGGSDAE